MWKAILQRVKATFPAIAGCLISTLCINQSYAQQYVIANKDNTRPETRRQFEPLPARVFTFTANRFNGYNEIQWNAAREQDTRRYIVEYSYDSYNFQSAGQVIAINGVYDLKHYTSNTRPALYRVRIEDLTGKFYYSENVFLNGRDILPVTIYPTVVTGNIVNANTFFPVERISVVSVSGQEVFAKDMNGANEFLKINIPSLSKGWYVITFYGNGWKTASKFMVG